MTIHLYPISRMAVVVGSTYEQDRGILDDLRRWLDDTSGRILVFSNNVDVVVHDG